MGILESHALDLRAVARGGAQGPWPPLLGKRSSKIDPFTPLILRIFCIFLTLFNISIPKFFNLTSLGIILYPNFLISCSCISKTFDGGFKGTNLVIPCLCIHENSKYFICISKIYISKFTLKGT